MTLTEKVAYLKGLVEGIGVDETTSQGKITKAILDVLDDMAFTVSDLEDSTSELYEELEAIDEDLGALEDEFYGEEDDDDDCCCDCEDDIYSHILEEGEIECPNCGELLTFEIEEDDCCCGCDCEEEDCGCCGHEEDK